MRKNPSRLCATDRPCFFLFSKQLAEMVYIHIVTYFHCVISQQQHCTTCRLFVQSDGICLFSVFLCVTGLLRRTITLPAANWCKKMWLKTFFPVIAIGYYTIITHRLSHNCSGHRTSLTLLPLFVIY